MIYLASAYSHRHWFVREVRYRIASRQVVELLREGKVAFSPIAFGHPLTALGLPTGWDFWRPFNTECLMRCDELHVLLFDGWQESKGVQTEVAMARMLGKPVRYRVID